MSKLTLKINPKPHKDWALVISVWVNVVIAAAAIATLALGLSQDRKQNRPYLGLADQSSITAGGSYTINEDGSLSNYAIKVQVELKNYGNQPTNFVPILNGWSGEVKPFQLEENYVMPGQTVSLGWNLVPPEKVDDICDLDKRLMVEVRYGDHTLMIKPEWMPDPGVGKKSGAFKAWRMGCGNGDEVRVWKIISSN